MSSSKKDRLLLLAAAFFFVLEQLRLLIAIGIHTTSEDQAIFWYAAKDYLHLHFTEPFFYGSPYSSHFESMLAAPLIALGLGPEIALPVAAIALTALPWILLAWLLADRGRPRMAAAILCLRFLFPLDFGAINTQAAHGTGVALVGIASVFILSEEASVYAYLSFGFWSVLATLLYPNSLFLSAPMALVLLATRARNRMMWLGGGAGATIAGLLYAWGRRFYIGHPGFVLHPQWQLQFSWSMFFEAFSKLESHLRAATPVFLSSFVFLVGSAVLLLWVSARTKKWAIGTAGGVAVAGVVLSLGFNKMRDGTDSFEFALSRVYLAIPLLIAFLTVLFSEGARIPRRVSGAALAILFAFAVGRQIGLAQDVDRVLSRPSPVVNMSRTQDILDRCEKLRELTRKNDADRVIEATSKVLAYACGALWYPSPKTLLPSYDRRTALFLDERKSARRIFIVDNAIPSLCLRAQVKGFGCHQISGDLGVAIIRTPPGSAGISTVELSRELGMKIRPF